MILLIVAYSLDNIFLTFNYFCFNKTLKKLYSYDHDFINKVKT